MNPSLPIRVLCCGKDEPLPETFSLRAGRLSLNYQAGDLRYVKFGGREVIRRIYAAVRDRNWGTIPAKLENVMVDARENSFRIRYDSEHVESDIHFVWRGEIIGGEDGTIRFSFDGEAKTTFLRNRIGFCLLHPIHECAGVPCRVEYVNGDTATVSFPKLVAPEQPVQGMRDLGAIAHEVVSGVWAELRFEGDVFETEDQRNWSDASFKTYCTPLRLPFPVEIKAGERVRQCVTLRLVEHGSSRGDEAHASNAGRRVRSAEFSQSLLTSAATDGQRRDVVEIAVSSRTNTLPSFGLGAPSHDIGYMEQDVNRLTALRSRHLRVDLRVGQPNWEGALWLSAGSADADASLELVLHLPTVSPMAMKDLARELEKRKAQLVRILVLQEGVDSTPERLLKLALQHLSFLDVPIGGGTSADFYQLNQFRPPAELCDFICWSMNPQVHAFDNASLAETPSAIPAQIESARACFPGKPLVISPVTLKPRFNPVATSAESGTDPNELPPQVDPRQMSLFGAGWTLAAFKYLAESGVDSVTFYETTGWRGVMETQAGSRLPEKFRSIPGGVFPNYHVLADIGEFEAGQVIGSQSSDPLKVDGFVLRKGARQRLMLANLTGEPQRVAATGLGGSAQLKRLNEINAEFAMREPEQFRDAVHEAVEPRDGRAELNLMPFEIARVDFAPARAKRGQAP